MTLLDLDWVGAGTFVVFGSFLFNASVKTCMLTKKDRPSMTHHDNPKANQLKNILHSIGLQLFFKSGFTCFNVNIFLPGWSLGLSDREQ